MPPNAIRLACAAGLARKKRAPSTRDVNTAIAVLFRKVLRLTGPLLDHREMMLRFEYTRHAGQLPSKNQRSTWRCCSSADSTILKGLVNRLCDRPSQHSACSPRGCPSRVRRQARLETRGSFLNVDTIDGSLYPTSIYNDESGREILNLKTRVRFPVALPNLQCST